MRRRRWEVVHNCPEGVKQRVCLGWRPVESSIRTPHPPKLYRWFCKARCATHCRSQASTVGPGSRSVSAVLDQAFANHSTATRTLIDGRTFTRKAERTENCLIDAGQHQRVRRSDACRHLEVETWSQNQFVIADLIVGSVHRYQVTVAQGDLPTLQIEFNVSHSTLSRKARGENTSTDPYRGWVKSRLFPVIRIAPPDVAVAR